ncbi:IS110 family transposase [Tomitella cavernea]|uniref:IS110 family transposase n=1 Tax=Tomitella cavernea TaxID=1387982 RepID=UPI00190342A0|nr:IS110 family transposase [Tomitella cavernea]
MYERTSVGLDVHARSVSATALNSETGAITETTLTPDHDEISAWIRTLPGQIQVVYEAGPTGFGLHRALTAAGIDCVVAAPSKLHRPPGNRVKTDKNDARLLAQLLLLGQITPVRVPTVTEESARDLVRGREDVRTDLMRARHRVSKLLLRHGHVYYGGRAWTGAHHQWLHRIRFDQPGTAAAYDAELEAVDFALARRDRLDAAIAEMAAASEFTPIVRNLCCLRGVSTLTGFGLAVEIGDWSRFTGASIGAYLGLVPTEHSSGGSRRQGGITKAGNTHARRLLVEAAWHHKARYTVGAVLRARWEQAPEAARARGHAGNQRLHHRWETFGHRHKKHTIATTAIARELAGWCWSLATLPD